MKKLLFPIFLSLLVLSFASTASAEDKSLPGVWNGAVELPGTSLEVIITFTNGDDVSGKIDIPMQGASGLDLVFHSADPEQLSFSISGIPGEPTFNGSFESEHQIKGNFSQGGQTFPFYLERKGAEDADGNGGKSYESGPGILYEILPEVMEKASEKWNIPGIAVGIVTADSVFFMQGFGTADIESGHEVTPDTRFAIGSTTKAFVGFAVSMLADEGVINLSDPVRTWMPDFRLYDNIATERLNAVDLLTHRSGLPRHDLAWYGSERTREELFQSLRYLEPSEDIRVEFQYQNLMYMAAGVLIERTTGQSWEDFTQDRIFNPLGMNGANFSVNDLPKTDDFARGHVYMNDEISVIPYRSLDAVGPAGSINASASDMGKWLQFLLNDGKIGGQELVSKSAVDRLFYPRISFPAADSKTKARGYGLGWFTDVYEGHHYWHHSGGIDGFLASVGLLPDAGAAYVVLTNSSTNQAINEIPAIIVDHMLNLDPGDWRSRYFPDDEEPEAEPDETTPLADGDEPDEDGRVTGTSPSFALEDYAGVYTHKGYGTAEVKYQDGSLAVKLNTLEFDLKHWHFDVFHASGDVMPGQSIPVQFNMDTSARLVSFTAQIEAAVDPIRFTKQADQRLTERSYLEQFAGDWLVEGVQSLKLEIRGENLIATLPNQPQYTLNAIDENLFELDGLPGFNLRFDSFDDKATSATMIQPNGRFSVKRVED